MRWILVGMASHTRQIAGKYLLLEVTVLSQPLCRLGMTFQAIIIGVGVAQLDGDLEGSGVIFIDVDHAFLLGLHGSEKAVRSVASVALIVRDIAILKVYSREAVTLGVAKVIDIPLHSQMARLAELHFFGTLQNQHSAQRRGSRGYEPHTHD